MADNRKEQEREELHRTICMPCCNQIRCRERGGMKIRTSSIL